MTFNTCLYLFKIEALRLEGLFSVFLVAQKFKKKTKQNSKTPHRKRSYSTSDLLMELTIRKY